MPSDWQEGETRSSVNVSVALRARDAGREANTEACLSGSFSEAEPGSAPQGKLYVPQIVCDQN